MIIFALALHVCTRTSGSALLFPPNPDPDSYITACQWRDPEPEVYTDRAVCQAAGQWRMKLGVWGDDDASISRQADKFRCLRVEVRNKP